MNRKAIILQLVTFTADCKHILSCTKSCNISFTDRHELC